MNTLYKPLIYEFIPGEPGTSTSTTSFGDGIGGSVYVPPTADSEITLFIPVTETAYYPGYGYGSTGIVTYEAVTVKVSGSSGGFRHPGSDTDTVTTTYTYTPPTPAQINTYFDREWNSAADSIDEIPAGSYIECKIQYGSHAVFVGMDVVDRFSTMPSAYRYGIMADVSGVRIFEGGVSGALLTVNSPTTVLRIHRSMSGKVYYQVVGQSLVPSALEPTHPADSIHGYGLLYSSLDAINDTVVGTATIAEVSVAFDIKSEFSVKAAPRVTFDITSDLALGLAPAVIFPITSNLEVTTSPVKMIDVSFPITSQFSVDVGGSGYGSWSLRPVTMFGAEEGYDAPGVGTWVLPRLSMYGTEQTYVPVTPDEGFWILPRAAMWGQGLSEDWGSGDWSLNALAMIGAEEGVDYSQGAWELPLHFGMISNDPWWPEGTAMLVSGLFDTHQPILLQTELVLVLNSSGILTSTFTMTRSQLLSLLSSLASSSSLTLSGIYAMSLLGNLSVSSMQALRTLTGADLPSDGAVWVVNMDTSASAQYDDYGFNSFFQRGDDYYGVANDGIYKLSGNTDAGAPIEAFAAFVRSTLGIQSVKHVPSVYIGAASDGALVMRVDVDGVARYYKARTSSTALNNHRVDIGRGVVGVYWEFELLNQNGDDFDIADITLLPVVRDRRI